MGLKRATAKPIIFQNRPVALKKIFYRDRLNRSDRILREVNTLNARKHDNIVLLLCYWTDLARESLDNCLNLVFPWAETDMKVWMNSLSAPAPLSDHDSLGHRKEFLYNTAQSLLSALSYIHREIDGSTASHHDLKPSNILLFDNQIWKICDFGKSGLKTLQDGSETDGQDGLGTRRYQPPEYGTSDVQKYGRAFDVWSMGCIIIELAILLVYGWDTGDTPQGFQEFTNQTTSNENRTDPFYNHESVVTQWLEKLEGPDDGSYNIISLLRTARNMTRMVPEDRVFSWEAYLDLYEQLNPSATIEDRCKITKEFVQKPSQDRDDSKRNPRGRIDVMRNSIRDKCLHENGWPPVQSRSSEIETLVQNFNSTLGQADVKKLFTFICDDYGDIEDQWNPLKCAEALIPADITFGETVGLFQYNNTSHSPNEAMGFRFMMIRIMKAEMNVNEPDFYTMTPLCWAAHHGYAAAAKVLLSLKGNINQKSTLGDTPLSIASSRGQNAHVEVVKVLLDHGADPQIQDHGGRTSISIAATCTNSKILKEFLSRERIDTRKTDNNGRSPLMHARQKLLVQQHRGVSEVDLCGLTVNVEKLEIREVVPDGILYVEDEG